MLDQGLPSVFDLKCTRTRNEDFLFDKLQREFAFRSDGEWFRQRQPSPDSDLCQKDM